MTWRLTIFSFFLLSENFIEEQNVNRQIPQSQEGLLNHIFYSSSLFSSGLEETSGFPKFGRSTGVPPKKSHWGHYKWLPSDFLKKDFEHFV